MTLRFTVGPDGRVLEVAVVGGSGIRALDDAAAALLRNATLPPPRLQLTRTVRLRYHLEN